MDCRGVAEESGTVMTGAMPRSDGISEDFLTRGRWGSALGRDAFGAAFFDAGSTYVSPVRARPPIPECSSDQSSSCRFG